MQSPRWVLLLAGVLYLWTAIEMSHSLSEMRFLRSDECAEEMGSNFIEAAAARSSLDCVARCRREPLCDVISFCKDVTGGRCVMSQRNLNSTSVAFTKASCSCYEKRCLHEGVMEPGGTCLCVNGYVGARCEALTSDCGELFRAYSHAENGAYLVKPLGAPRPFLVRCLSGGRTVMMRKMKRSADFNRTWDDYVQGFGSTYEATGYFWRGLKYWHYLTSSKTFHLNVNVVTQNGQTYRRQFRDFWVGDETTNFTMTFSGSRKLPRYGDLGDSMSASNGSQFSTFDKDHDTSPSVHCAQTHGGGWWFSDCGDSNPTGPLLKPPGGVRLGIPAEAFWEHDLGTAALGSIRFCLVD